MNAFSGREKIGKGSHEDFSKVAIEMIKKLDKELPTLRSASFCFIALMLRSLRFECMLSFFSPACSLRFECARSDATTVACVVAKAFSPRLALQPPIRLDASCPCRALE